jgi:late competence protein required for DNA uptake (superfamily II DNA/RNA helicase)
MKCSRCGEELKECEQLTLLGKILCEECYMYESNPPKACDPLAVSSALSIRKQLGQTGAGGLTMQQKKIYMLIMEKVKVTRHDIASSLSLTSEVVEAELATLRHCELIRARKEDNLIYITLL